MLAGVPEETQHMPQAPLAPVFGGMRHSRLSQELHFSSYLLGPGPGPGDGLGPGDGAGVVVVGDGLGPGDGAGVVVVGDGLGPGDGAGVVVVGDGLGPGDGAGVVVVGDGLGPGDGAGVVVVGDGLGPGDGAGVVVVGDGLGPGDGAGVVVVGDGLGPGDGAGVVVVAGDGLGPGDGAGVVVVGDGLGSGDGAGVVVVAGDGLAVVADEGLDATVVVSSLVASGAAESLGAFATGAVLTTDWSATPQVFREIDGHQVWTPGFGPVPSATFMKGFHQKWAVTKIRFFLRPPLKPEGHGGITEGFFLAGLLEKNIEMNQAKKTRRNGHIASVPLSKF